MGIPVSTHKEFAFLNPLYIIPPSPQTKSTTGIREVQVDQQKGFNKDRAPPSRHCKPFGAHLQSPEAKVGMAQVCPWQLLKG